MEQTSLGITADTLDLIASNFSGLYSGDLGLSSIKGGQAAANIALENLDITGYAANQSEVLPLHKRGASVLSPYIRHNLLTIDQVYRTVKDAPFKDNEKFRDELYWQEYARHLYARLGSELFRAANFRRGHHPCVRAQALRADCGVPGGAAEFGAVAGAVERGVQVLTGCGESCGLPMPAYRKWPISAC